MIKAHCYDHNEFHESCAACKTAERHRREDEEDDMSDAVESAAGRVINLDAVDSAKQSC